MSQLRRIIRHINDLLGVPIPESGKYLRWKQDLSGLENALLGAIGSVNGGIFITDITVQSPGTISNKITSSSGLVLDSCTSDTAVVSVSIVAITGHTNYVPMVTVNEVEVPLVATSDKPMFTGMVSITVPTGGSITALHEDGAYHTCYVAMESRPVIQSAVFDEDYPGTQTELKAGDQTHVTITSDIDIVTVEISSYGVGTSTTHVVAPATIVTVPVTVADRGTTPDEYYGKVRVQKASGSWSAWVLTTNTMVLNNKYPSAVFGSITYPQGQQAIKNSESALVAFTCSDYDALMFTSPTNELSITAPTSMGPQKTVTRISGDYNVTTSNVRAALTKASNNAVTVVGALVKITNTNPNITITTPYTRLRTPLNHTITLTSNQPLIEPPSINAPEGSWLGSSFIGGSSVWTRILSLTDADSKGPYTFNSLQAKNLAGIVTTIISGSPDYIIGGFTLRTLTVPAYPNRQVSIGTEVVSTSKLRCTNLSKGASGSLNYAYQPTTEEGVNRYTILNSDTWYNCDGGNATSNTTGTMLIEIEEVV